jgi:thiol-disulfide isomerase/thioredoxin
MLSQMTDTAPRPTPGSMRWLAALSVAVAIVAAVSVSMGDKVESHEEAPAANLDFTLKDMEGRDVALASFRGRPIILNFWATWCGPCKAEIPALNEVADAYRAQRLAVLGISVDDKPELLREFSSVYKMNYPVLVGLGHEQFQEIYGALHQVPVTWLIRGDGTVFLKHDGPVTKEWLDAKVRSLVGAAPQP